MSDNVETRHTWIETPSFIEELKEKCEKISLKINVLLKQEINKNHFTLRERKKLSVEDVKVEFERQIYFLSSWEKCNTKDFSEKYKKIQSMFTSYNNSRFPDVLKDFSYASINQSHERDQTNNFALNKNIDNLDITKQQKDGECLKHVTNKLKKFKLNSGENSTTIYNSMNMRKKTRRGKRTLRTKKFKNMLFSSIVNFSYKEEDKIFVSKYQSIYIQLCKMVFEFNYILKVHSSLIILSKKIEKLIKQYTKQCNYQDLRYIFNIIRNSFKNCKTELNSYIANIHENEYVWKLCLDTYNQTLQNEKKKLWKLQVKNQSKHEYFLKYNSLIEMIKEYYHKLTLQIKECELIIMELEVKKKDIVMEIAMLTSYICKLKIRNEDVKEKITSNDINTLISHLTACNLVNDISATLKAKRIQIHRTV